MKNQIYVSLFVGNAVSKEKIFEYIEYDYENDEVSQFEKDFRIKGDDFDEDFTDVIFIEEKTNSLKKLLSGCSYEDKVIPEFEKIFHDFSKKKFNAGMLLYDMNYQGDIKNSDNKYCQLEFVGTVKINIK